MDDSRARVRLHDILDEIEGIRSVTAGLIFADFDRAEAAASSPPPAPRVSRLLRGFQRSKNGILQEALLRR